MGKAEVVGPASFFDTFLFLIDFVVKSNLLVSFSLDIPNMIGHTMYDFSGG